MASLKDLIVMGPARFLDKLYGNLEGNATSATKLQTPRAINGTNFDGTTAITTANWGTARNIYIQDSDGSNTGAAVSVNGGANVTLKLPATIKASLSGNASTATTATYALKMQTYKYNSTQTYGTSYPLYAQWNQQGNVLLLKCDNYTVNTDTATKLATARTINGTSFDGSSNITTANWGTARTLTIGNKGQSINGSGNVSWSLQDIGTLALDGSTHYVSLTAGDGNTTGYRLIGQSNITTWANKRISFIVSSRHTGNGLVTINYGCNSSTLSAENCYCTIRYFGISKNDDGYAITEDSFVAHVSSDGAIMYFFWKYSDYNSTYITVLKNNSAFTPSNGTWMTSINTSTYGSQIATTVINRADSVYDAYADKSITFAYSQAGLSTTSWFAAWNGYELRGISPTNSRITMSALSATNANGYYGMGAPDGDTTNWIRTTVNGIIPYQSGGSSSLGTESWPFNYIYTKNLTSYGPIRVGNNANGDTNYISFYGTTGDGPGSHNHTFIGENLYGGSEGSELVIFKGNDIDSESGGSPGPDRIRHIAARHLFQTYDSALSGSWTTICDSTVPVTKFEIRPTWIRAHVTSSFGTSSASYALNAASFYCDDWVRTKGATGWYSQDYGGGWHMSDSTWIRAYNNKKIYVSNADGNSIKTDGGIAAASIESCTGYNIFRLADDISMSSLGTSAAIEEYIKLYIKSICSKYPGKHGVFRGKCSPNSVAYIEVYIYDTSTVNSTTGLPQYCFGTWRQYTNTFYKFWTSEYTFGMSTIVDSSNFSSILNGYYDSRYLKLSGGTMTGALNFANGTWNKAGDDAQFGDNNTAGSFAIQGLNGTTNLKLVKYGDSNSYATISWDGTYITSSGHLALPASKHFYMTYNNTKHSVLYNHDNGNVSLRACGGGLFIGYGDTTTGIHFGPSGNWGSISSSGYSGNAATATKLQTARTIFGRSFNGTSNVEGQVDCYGSYTASANQRYYYCALEIRENGLVGNAQSDIGYAPSIGFHWANRSAATLNYHSDGIFYFRKQDGTSRATIDANVNGWASSAGSATTATYLVEDESFNLSRHSFQYFNISGTAGAAVSTNDTPTTAWWHIQRHTHANSAGYYTDVAIPFNDNQIYYKRVAGGSLQNGGWVMLYDTKNIIYSSIEPTSGLKAGMIWLKPV